MTHAQWKDDVDVKIAALVAAATDLRDATDDSQGGDTECVAPDVQDPSYSAWLTTLRSKASDLSYEAGVLQSHSGAMPNPVCAPPSPVGQPGLFNRVTYELDLQAELMWQGARVDDWSGMAFNRRNGMLVATSESGGGIFEIDINGVMQRKITMGTPANDFEGLVWYGSDATHDYYAAVWESGATMYFFDVPIADPSPTVDPTAFPFFVTTQSNWESLCCDVDVDNTKFHLYRSKLWPDEPNHIVVTYDRVNPPSEWIDPKIPFDPNNRHWSTNRGAHLESGITPNPIFLNLTGAAEFDLIEFDPLGPTVISRQNAIQVMLNATGYCSPKAEGIALVSTAPYSPTAPAIVVVNEFAYGGRPKDWNFHRLVPAS